MKYKWSKYVTRRLAVQVAQAWNFGWGKAMKKIYGVSVENTLIYRDGQKTEYYVDTKQHMEYIIGLYKLLNNKKFIKEFHRKSQIKLESILKVTKDRFKKDLSKLSSRELLEIYKNFVLPNLEQFYIRMWTVFNINEPLADVIRKELIKKFKDDILVDNYLLKLASPLVSNDVLNERIDLLNLAIKKSKVNSAKFELLIERHTKKYQHIPMFDFDHEPYSHNYFLIQINKVKNPEGELAELKKVFAERKKELRKIIDQIKPNKRFLALIKFLQENVFLRDYRDMIRQKYNLELKKFYAEVGKRLGLTIEQIAVLTNEEIINYLKKEQIFPKAEIKKRSKAYLLIQKGNNVQIFSGGEAVNKANNELDIKDVIQTDRISGIVGSKGKARGRVVVVFTNKDLFKVKEGDVMVATMTRQDFVPAIRKSVALITDEGSVVCHAAIIAREFKIPCIVNTKIGTKVFKDGDVVEVDAVSGIVKKI